MKRKNNDTGMAAELVRLKQEIALNREFFDEKEAVFLSLTWTWLCVERMGRKFFARYNITDAQFNALMILWDYRAHGLKQHELADLLVVNRASAGGVIDRMQRSGWVRRESDPVDRRAYFVYLTDAGIAKLDEVKKPYYKLLSAALEGIDHDTLAAALHFNDVFRSRLNALAPTNT